MGWVQIVSLVVPLAIQFLSTAPAVKRWLPWLSKA